MDVLQWSRHYRCFPGQGGLDVVGLVGHVLRTGYDGPLSLEVYNDVFRQADAGRTAVDGLRSLLALEEHTGVSPLPAPVVPSGVAFAELATSDAQPVAELLGALGFARTARHRGKPVDLWEQSTARFLVNSGTATCRTGTTLAAVGLETPDPAAAVRPGEALLAPTLPKRRSAHDVPLESIAAPDGTELLFCATDRPELPSWTDDFESTAPAAAPAPVAGPSALISGIDHLAFTQPWHRFDEAVLFHRITVLGLRPHDTVELADAYGLFRSRALSAPYGGPRLVLNLAPSATESDTRAQHVAFAVDGITAAVRRVRAAGAGLLRIPDNYYDDLGAVRVPRRGAGDVPRTRHPLRPRRPGRGVPALLHADRRPRLLRARPAHRRLPRLRRRQRPRTPRRPTEIAPSGGDCHRVSGGTCATAGPGRRGRSAMSG